jgi:hypothetical protein
VVFRLHRLLNAESFACFIAMTSNGSPVNWLMEVQHVLDGNRCPIVQIIDDDKGVHIVAAINFVSKCRNKYLGH